jgi:Domain of unknown function (DUF4384)
VSCPSRFELARATSSRAPASAGGDTALGAHLTWCGRCRRAVEELEASRRELLGDDEDGAARAAARTLTAAAAERRAGRNRRWAFAFMPCALAAAAFALWVKPSHEVRAKGAFVIDLYCKRGDTVFPAQDGGDFLPGDRLRFATTTSDAGYVVVFGVDDRGGVFPYYPERSLAGVALPAGDKVLLPGSIELDAHRGWERTFALWSRAPFDERELRTQVSDLLRAAGGDLRRAARLPGSVAQSSYLLRRP